MMSSGMRITKKSPGIPLAAGAGRFATDDERWKAVIRRDPAADGKFCYAVTTTGVYCRPSCASRRPRRGNIRFHASCEDAERAGFRACKRCQPNGSALASRHAAAVAAACRTIETAEEPPDLNALARAAGMSRFHFHRVFTKVAGLTPKRYAIAHRSERMRRELTRRATVTEAIYEAGFNSTGRFYEESAGVTGMKPRNFRMGGRGEEIHFAIGRCSLGFVLVAASGKGICAISLGGNRRQLGRELRNQFRRARLVEGERAFGRIVAKVIQFVEAPQTGLDLPLDLRGTVFQRRVWRLLRRIRPGSTASYSEVARMMGSSKSARAVASACAANTIAVAIPCHRILRTDGSLSGYRWGVERKRALLLRERAGREATASR